MWDIPLLVIVAGFGLISLGIGKLVAFFRKSRQRNVSN